MIHDLCIDEHQHLADKQVRAKLMCHIVEPNLSSPSSLRRLFCLELLVELQKYEHAEENGQTTEDNNGVEDSKDGKEKRSPYQLALEAEKMLPTLGEYRERARLFDLLARSVDSSLRAQQEHIVKYLLGSIYVNFEKLWGPAIRTISDVLKCSKWQWNLVLIVLNNLRATDNLIYNNDDQQQKTLLTPIDSNLFKLIPRRIQSIIEDEQNIFIKDRPDHVLHRHLLYQILVNHSSIIEKHQTLQERFIDSLLLFVQKNLLVSPFIEKVEHQNLLKHRNTVIDDNKCHEDDKAEDYHEGENKNEASQVQQRTRKKKAKHDVGHSTDKTRVRDTFTTAFKTLKEFKNIRDVHREPEISELILNLLCSRDNSIQHAAFNCLLAYEHDYIKPYTDKILHLMSDKMIRTELTLFSVESDEHRVLQPSNADKVDHVINSHRKQVMPIIMRIIFGKMLGRIGKRIAGKDKSDQRKTLVMRFIAGCKTEEIIFFLGLVLGPTFDYIKLTYPEIESKLSADKINLAEYVPLFKLHAIIMSLHAFMKEVAPSKPKILPFLMKTIIVIIMLVNQPLQLQKDDQVCDEKTIKTLKDLKRRCFLIINMFFTSFDYYEYQEVEVNSIFKHLIWGSAQDFANRNQSRPTPLFLFIEIISKNPGYYQLLVKKDECSDKTLMDCVMDLFRVEPGFTVTRNMLKFTATVIANLLRAGRKSALGSDSGDEDEEMYDAPTDTLDTLLNSVSVGNQQLSNYDKDEFILDGPIEVHFGIEILLGYVPTILKRLQNNCQQLIAMKKSEFRIELDELEILSTLGGLIKSPEQCMICAKLLVLTLHHQSKEELKLETIKAIQCMFKYIKSVDDIEIVSLIGDIFSSLGNMTQRMELCKLLEILAKVKKDISDASEIMSRMNKIYHQAVDTPDVVEINEGFKKAFDYIEGLQNTDLSDASNVYDSCVLLVNQVCYLINNNDRYEYSIRSNCMLFFEKLSLKMQLFAHNCICCSATDKKFFDCLINELLLQKFIKRGLRDTNEEIKNLYISVLRSFAINCCKKGNPWSELSLFCDTNMEADFWLNVKHIQLHTRSRALSKLVSSPELNNVSPKTLSTFLLPIAAGFLFSRVYKSVASLAQNSIKLISIICKRLNWSTYESILNYYLSMLTKANTTYQKTNIKLITEIIKSFNFDLSACQDAAEQFEENVKLERRMRKRRDKSVSIIHTDAPSGKRLNPSTARMVYNSITKKLLPRLNSCLHEATHVEFEHDKNMSDYKPEKDEIKRIPIAYAIVQLLNILPNRYVLFREHLQALFLKLCSFLKSKNEIVRKTARATLVKIMKFVGPAYMPDLLREMKQSLDKGFQIHVLNYTIHSVLNKLPLHYGDLDHCAQELINTCAQEIFGRISEDKQIAQILAKTFEAKKTKSYDTLLILATHIGADKLHLLMENFINSQLKTATEPKILNKLTMCVQKIYTGLSKNEKFPIDKLLTFVEANIRNSLPSLKVPQKVEQATSTIKSKQPLRPDRFLIEKDLPRDRVKSKINEKGNFHMIVENSLRLLLHNFIRHKQQIDRKPALKKQLNGFVGLLSTCLKSSSPRTVSRALKCIFFIAQTKSDFPSFKQKSVSLVKRIFILLNRYNGIGMVRGDNLEMIMMCFKTLTLLLTRCGEIELNETQLNAFLSYIEQDIHDDTRQATAFKALQAILKRKLEASELNEIMKKVADLVVTSEDDTVRRLCVINWSIYLIDYPHTSVALQNHLRLFMRQMDYEFIDGRKSLLELFDIIVAKFPQSIIQDNLELIFHLLSQRLVNEELPAIRKLIGDLIGKLLKRCPEKEQNHIFNKAVIPWASSDAIGLRMLSVKLMTIYINACKSLIDRTKISQILTTILKSLEHKDAAQVNGFLTVQQNGKHSDDDVTDNDDNGVNRGDNEEAKSKETVRLVTVHDELNCETLALLKLMLEKKFVDCVDVRFMTTLKSIWQRISSQKLTDWHLPVVLLSCELYAIFLDQTDLGNALNVKDPSPDDYINWNAKRIVRLLCDQYISLIDRAAESNELQIHLTKSLITLGQFVAKSSTTIELEEAYKTAIKKTSASPLEHMLGLPVLPNDGFDSEKLPAAVRNGTAKKRTDLFWLATKIVMQARKEAAKERLKNFHRRILVLRWTAAIAGTLGEKRLQVYAVLFVMTPARELTDQGKISKDSPQKAMLTMAEDLLKFVKNVLSLEKFNKLYANVQLFFTKKRVERKKKLAVSRVTDQAGGVKRKLKASSKKNKAKNEARKTKRIKMKM